MNQKTKYITGIVLSVLVICALTIPAFALTESDVQSQVSASGKEGVAGNLFVWFLCAVAFLKISQKIDSFMQGLGINVGHTGGSIELKISANNRPYLRFDLAERTGKGAYARAQYYQVVAFGAIASQFAKRGLCRGALISVEGTLELEDYLKRDGWTRDKRLKIIALRWRYLQPYDTKVPEQVPEIDGEREPLPG